MRARCYQVDLQQSLGGGEVYAVAFARALAALGVESILFIHARAKLWEGLALQGVRVERIGDAGDIVEALRAEAPAWLAFHTFADARTLAALRERGHLLTAFAHMPLYSRDPEPVRRFDLVIAVSRHVIASLRAAGIEAVHPEPLYGMAEISRPPSVSREGADTGIRARSPYDWDRRKLRDRLFGAIEPALRVLAPARYFERREGFTLGVVSRITPIKQFPLLFDCIAPVIRRHPEAHLEIFGSGGYASVRDLRRSLSPIAGQVRFWGHQPDVGAVYRRLDALLTGLPEKEALGLNVLEAQACGVPALAPDAPPFDESVLDGVTGLRYRDPRQDGGADFERCLRRLLEGRFRFDARRAEPHLAQFGEAAFTGRVRRLLESVLASQRGADRPAHAHLR